MQRCGGGRGCGSGGGVKGRGMGSGVSIIWGLYRTKHELENSQNSSNRGIVV